MVKDKMIIPKTKQVEEFCKKNKLQFVKEIKFDIANRTNSLARKKENLLIKVGNEKDYMKQKNSSIDEVFCKYAKEHEKNIFIDLNELLSSNKKHFTMQKIKQNIRLLKKYKLKYSFVYVCENVSDIISNEDILAFRRVLELKKG
jgi:RNase P/RNase MRP subunit p30